MAVVDRWATTRIIVFAFLVVFIMYMLNGCFQLDIGECLDECADMKEECTAEGNKCLVSCAGGISCQLGCLMSWDACSNQAVRCQNQCISDAEEELE